MHDYHYPRAFLGDVAACLLATILIAAFALGVFGLQFGSAEEGPLETVQEWFLALSFAFLVASAWRQPRGAPRLASISGAVLAAVFFLRELEPVGSGPIATYVQSSAFRVHEGVAIGVVAAILAPSAVRFAPEIARWLFGRSSWPFLLAGAFVLAGEIIDGHHVLWGVEWLPRFIEECCETFAYALILAASLRWYRLARGLSRAS